MIITDSIFRLFYGPFQNVKNGRQGSLPFLIQILTAYILGLTNIIFGLLGIDLTSLQVAGFAIIIGIIVYRFFNKIYVLEKRDVGKIQYPFIHGLVILTLLVGSIFFLIFSLAKY